MSEAAHIPMAEAKEPAANMTIAPLSAEHVDTAWEMLVPMLERIPGIGKRYTTDDVRDQLKDQTLQAWGIFDTDTRVMVASFYTEVISYPAGWRVIRIPYVAGDGMEDWIGFLPNFEAWAKEQGFDEVEIAGRPGWQRVTGYTERSRTFVKELGDVG